MRDYIFIKVQPLKAREVAGKIAEIAGVKVAHVCWGLPDVIAQVEADDEEAVQELIIGQIQATEGVTETDTHIVLED